MRSATSRWNISTARSNQGGHGSTLSHPTKQRRGDVVGQIGDDAHGPAGEQRARIERAARRPRRFRAGRDNARRSPASAAIARSSRSTAMTRAAPSANSARVRPPGPGPTSNTVAPASGPPARAMRAVRLRSNRKFCPSDFSRDETVAANDLAQRRQAVAVALVTTPASGARLSGHGKPCRKLQRGDQARRIGAAGAGDVEGGAVVGRGAHERQAERDVDGMIESQRLDRDQRLVVIHAQSGVVSRARLRRETANLPAAALARRCPRRRAAPPPARR